MNLRDKPRHGPRSSGGAQGATALILAFVAVVGVSNRASAQAGSVQGRFALFTSWSQRSWRAGATADFPEIIGMLTLYGGGGPESTFEFGLDSRVASYPSTSRDQRISLYEAYVGLHSRNGAWNVRLGQMWLHELGGLGSFGGIFAEYRQPQPSSWGQWRFGLFAGYELQTYQLDYLKDIGKGGVYVALDGDHGRQHVLGYVSVRNQGLTERSVIVFSNYVPIGRSLRLYQALEYDTEGPAGLGGSELTYFMANLNYQVSPVIGIQGTYHEGRSIDTRSITEDVIDGRPVAPESLDALLFESARLRLMVRPARNISVWAGYGTDRNNRDDPTSNRFNLGFSARRLFGSAADFNLSATRTDRGEDTYDSLWGSLGYAFGSRVYVSLEYRDTLSVYHLSQGDGASVEIRPNSTLYSITSNVSLNHTFSLLIEFELLNHSDFDERRVMTGLIIRF
jgi:hypothetical protein